MKYVLLPVCVGLSACATPDLTSELEAFSKSATQTNTELVKYAKPLAAAELNRARQARIRQGQSPIQLSCQPGLPLDECVIVEGATPPDEDGVWTATLEFSAALTGYLKAFEALVKADTPAQINVQTAALFQSVAAFKDVPIANVPETTTQRAAALANPVGALAEQAALARKYRALRRAAEPTDRALGRMLDALSADGVFPKAERAFEALDAAAVSFDTDKQRTMRDLRNVEARHKAYLDAVKATPVETFRRMRAAHADLLAALQSQASPSDVLAFVNKLNDLKAALEDT